jgi:RimJ/RimL family protein N-acetyltransferase
MAIHYNLVNLKNGKDLLQRNAEEKDAEKMIEYLNIIGGESDNLLFGKGSFRLNVDQEREYLKNAKEDPNTLMLLGFIDGNIVSVSQISASNRARIAHNSEISISVKKEYWHMGIGNAQMNELIAFAKNSGNTRNITLGVRHVNENAIKLYEKCGFIKVGVHKNFFNIDGNFYDEILMDLFLY